LAWVIAFGGGAALAAACGGGDDSHPPYSSGNASGGSSGHAGHGSGGTKPGAAGEAGGGAGGVSSGESGAGGTLGNAGGPVLGTAGVPYTGDRGFGAGTGGGGGAPGPGDGAGHLFIGPGGYDAAQGTREDPLGTLAGAAALATSGDTIVFLAGNYGFPALDDAIVIPDGVDIAADEPRLVELVGSGGALLELAGDTHIDGIRFTGFDTIATATSAHGAVTVTNSVFSACPSNSGNHVFEVAGGATIALSVDPADPQHDWGNCPAFAHADETGTFTLDGGVVHFSGNGEPSVFSASASATLGLSNLTATDGDRTPLVLDDSARATLTASTLSTWADNIIVLGGGAALDVTNTELSLADAPHADACILSNVDQTTSLTLAHSLVHDCRAGLAGTAPATLTITDTQFYAMSESGLDLTTANGSTVELGMTSFSRDALRAARFGGGDPSVFHVRVHGTTVATTPTGFELAGDVGSSFDFGTLAEPGGNTFGATMTSLFISNANVPSVSAVGNTWAADVQGADGSGLYAASGPGAVLEVTSGSGQNYDDTVGVTLRLAENP
jgi:hypothetical protein